MMAGLIELREGSGSGAGLASHLRVFPKLRLQDQKLEDRGKGLGVLSPSCAFRGYSGGLRNLPGPTGPEPCAREELPLGVP